MRFVGAICLLVLSAQGLVSAQSPVDSLGSGYMLAYPMDESGMVAAESSPAAVQVASVEEVKKDDEIVALPTPETPSRSSESSASSEAASTTTSTPKPTTTRAPYKAPSEADRKRKIEEMRKILGLPTPGSKPKFLPPEKPKSIFPSLLLKAALPRLQDSPLAEFIPLPLSLISRRSDSSDGNRRAVLSNIFQAASAFMRRAITDDDGDVQSLRGKRNGKSKDSDDLMILVDEDKANNSTDNSEEEEDDDEMPYFPFPRPGMSPLSQMGAIAQMRMPFNRPSPFQFRNGMPFGLPTRQQFNIAMGPRRMPQRQFVRMPMHPNQYPPRPLPMPFMGPSPFHGHHQMGHMPMQAHHQPMFAPAPHPMMMGPRPFPHPHMMPHPMQFVPHPPPMQFHPAMHPMQFHPAMHPMHQVPYEHMSAPSHHVPSPIQPVLIMLHPVPVHHPMPPPPQRQQSRAFVPDYQAVPYPMETDDDGSEDREQDEQEGNNSPRYVMVLDNSLGRSMPQQQSRQQFQFHPQQMQQQQYQQQPQMLSPLRKMQIIREIIMARQHLIPRPSSLLMGGQRQTPNVFPFHPPVPRVQKMVAELSQRKADRLAASMLRPIFLQAAGM